MWGEGRPCSNLAGAPLALSKRALWEQCSTASMHEAHAALGPLGPANLGGLAGYRGGGPGP